jgi:hypothetical protein
MSPKKSKRKLKKVPFLGTFVDFCSGVGWCLGLLKLLKRALDGQTSAPFGHHVDLCVLGPFRVNRPVGTTIFVSNFPVDDGWRVYMTCGGRQRSGEVCWSA